MKGFLIASAAAAILGQASTASAQVPQRPTSSPVVQPPVPAPNAPPASAQQPPPAAADTAPAASLRRLPGAATTQLPGSVPTRAQPPTATPSGAAPGLRQLPGEAGSRPVAPAPATAAVQPPPTVKQQSAAAADGLPPPPKGWRLPGDAKGQPMSSAQPTASAEAPRRPGLRPTRRLQRMTRYGPSGGYMPSRLDRPEMMQRSVPGSAMPATEDPPYPWRGYPPQSWMPK
jgi:translation initiation factor IF-2